MITKTTVSHSASQCPQHPNTRIVREDITEKSGTKLMELHCAVDDCNHPLGWHYRFNQGSNVHVMSGPGACQNPDVRAHQVRIDHDAETCFRAGVAVVIATLPGMAGLFTWNSDPIAALALAAAGTACSAALAYNIVRRLRSRPQKPDMAQSMTAQPQQT